MLQVSKDSDNVCLALLALTCGKLERAHNVVVKMGHEYFDIKQLRAAVQNANMTVRSIAILYSLSGNDFNASCAVATNKAMIST